MITTIAGIVSDNGDKRSGDGFASKRDGQGIYEITFTKAFKTIYGGSVTQIYWDEDGNTRDNAVISQLDTTKLRLKTGDGSGNKTNREFTFIVVGDLSY